MTYIFVSFHAGDGSEYADRLMRGLENHGYRDLFVFDSRAHGSPAGSTWLPNMVGRLLTADVVVALTTAGALTSPRCSQEIAIARHRGVPVIEIVLGAESNPLLSDLQHLRVDEVEVALDWVVGYLRTRDLGPSEAPRTSNVYPGLRPYGEAESAYFFGREREVRDLARRLDQSIDDGGALAVVGPSGVGKSSLVRAGLVPALRHGRGLVRQWSVAEPVLAGTSSVRELVASMAHAGGQDDVPTEELVEALESAGTTMVDLLARVWPVAPGGRRLLVLDQAEELLGSDQHDLKTTRTALGRLAVLRAVRIVYTLRVDRLEEFQADEILRGLTTEIHPVNPLGREGLFDVIARPARRCHWEFTSEAVAAIHEDVEKSSLPLLAYALSELWVRVTQDGRETPRIDLNDYKATGRVSKLLSERAETAYADARVRAAARHGCSPQDDRCDRAVLDVLRRFVIISPEGKPSRRPVPIGELAEERVLVDPFVHARVFTVVGGKSGGDASIEVSHEALFEGWNRFTQELARVQVLLRLCGDVDRRAADWVEASRPVDALMPPSALLQLIAALDGEVSSGRVSDWPEIDRQLASAGLGPVSRDFVGSSLQDVLQREVDRGHRDAEVRPDIAMRALSGVESPLQASVMDLAAMAPDPRPLIDVLHRVMAAHPVLLAVHAHRRGSWGVRWSPDGRYFATAGRDHSAAVWALATTSGAWTDSVQRFSHGEESDSTGVRESWVRTVCWSGHANLVLSGATDRTVRLWVLDSGADVAVWGHRDRLWTVDTPRTGIATVVTADASEPGVLRLYDLARGVQEPRREWRVPARLWGAALSPDGRRVAVAGRDRRSYIYDVDDLALLPLVTEHPDQVRAISWHPAGHRIATGCQDGVVRVVDARDGTVLFEMSGHSEQVRAVRWSDSGGRIASASADASVRVWDLATRASVSEISGHDQGVCDVDWSLGGDRLLSAADDGWVRLWKIGPESTVVAELPGRATAADWSPEAESLAIAILAPDGVASALVFDDSRQEVCTTPVHHTDAIRSVQWVGSDLLTAAGHQSVVRWATTRDDRTDFLVTRPTRGPMTGAAHSPRHDVVIAINEDKVIRRWIAGRPVEDGEQEIHKSFLRGLAWSPQGDRFAVVSEDRLMTIHEGVTERYTRVDLGGLGSVVAWSPSGDQVAVGMKDGSIHVHRLDDADGVLEMRVWCFHTHAVRALAWSPDGVLLCSVSADGRAAIWREATGAVLTTLVGHRGAVTGCGWPSSRQVLTCGEDGTLRSWTLDDVIEHPLAGSAGRMSVSQSEATEHARELLVAVRRRVSNL